MSWAWCLPEKLRRASVTFVQVGGTLWLYDASTGILVSCEAVCDKVPVPEAIDRMKAGVP